MKQKKPNDQEIRSLPVPINPQERLGKLENLNALFHKLGVQQFAKTSTMGAFNTIIKGIELDLENLSKELSDGMQEAPVLCEWQKDWEHKLMVLVRTDNMNKVEDRPMTAKEMEDELFSEMKTPEYHPPEKQKETAEQTAEDQNPTPAPEENQAPGAEPTAEEKTARDADSCPKCGVPRHGSKMCPLCYYLEEIIIPPEYAGKSKEEEPTIPKESDAEPGTVEEDGDEVFTPIPEYCVVCSNKGIEARIEEREGFYVCSACGNSYGKVHKDFPAPDPEANPPDNPPFLTPDENHNPAEDAAPRAEDLTDPPRKHPKRRKPVKGKKSQKEFE